jgi:hypothetical protein
MKNENESDELISRISIPTTMNQELKMEPAGYSVYSHSMTSNFNHELNISNIKNEV